MTRKHFVALASVLAAVRPDPDDDETFGPYLQWMRCVRAVADACAETSPAFKRQRFYDACGGM